MDKKFDLSGKKISTIDNYECKSSFCSIKWDGRNNEGINVSTGNYFVNIINENRHITKMITLIK